MRFNAISTPLAVAKTHSDPMPAHIPHANAHTWWFTGLPGAGKSTLANAWAERLRQRHPTVVVLDGDELRQGLNRDLGFSDADRLENMRRVAELARLLNANGIHALVALVSPTRTGRALARSIVGDGQFTEVFVATPLGVCQQRDPKGLYRRAAAQEPFGLTGVQSPYEAPEAAEMVVDTSQVSVAEVMTLLAAAWNALPNNTRHDQL